MVDCGNLPNNTYKDVAHNISNLGRLVDLWLTVTTGTTQYVSNMKGTNQAYSSGVLLARINATDIQVVTDGDLSAHTGIAIIEYTKTTD